MNKLYTRIKKDLEEREGKNYSTILNFTIFTNRYSGYSVAALIHNNSIINFCKNNNFFFLDSKIENSNDSTKYFLCKINFEKFDNFLKTKSKNKKINIIKLANSNTIFINYIYKRRLILLSSSVESDISKICDILYENKKISNEMYLKHKLDNSTNINILI